MIETKLSSDRKLFTTSVQKNDFWRKNQIVKRSAREDAAIKILEARDKKNN